MEAAQRRRDEECANTAGRRGTVNSSGRAMAQPKRMHIQIQMRSDALFY